MRKVFASLFALLAILVGASQALLLAAGEPMHPMLRVALASFAGVSAFNAYYLFRPRAAWEASLICPHCHKAELSPSALGQPHPSIIALILGGIFFTVLIQQSQPRRFQCGACSAESRRRTVGSWL